jgi:hypothetical protein
VSFEVILQYLDGGWRAVAPPRGDWGEVAMTSTIAPDGLLDYAGAS